MRKLNLDILRNGLSGVSNAAGAFFAEAAIASFVKHKHNSGVKIKVSGEFEETFEVIWTLKDNKFLEETWTDTKESIEYGATAIALLLLFHLTDFQHYQRLGQDGIGDYIIKYHKTSKKNAFLEISGISKSNASNTIDIRIKAKNRQITNKVKSNVELFVIVTEFSIPKAKIKRNEIS